MPESAVAEVTQTSTPASPAPSSAAPASSAATPATAAATPASPTSERPLSPNSTQKDISEFLRKLDTPDATTTTPVAAAPDGATTQPAATEPKSGVTASTPKAPPEEAWPNILENARSKAVEGFRSQYGITPQVTPDVFQKGIGFARAINENPIAFLNKLSADIANHPVWGPQLRSSAGRTLASAPAARPEPDVEIRNEAGQVVGRTYSAERLQAAQDWDWAQREQALNQKIQPLVSAEERRQQEAEQAAFQKEADAGAQTQLARVNAILEGKTELGPKVAELMAQGMDPIDAALKVRQDLIVPTLTATAEAAVLDKTLKKVAGNTVNGSGTPAPKTKLHPGMSQKELAAALREMDEVSA